MNAIFTSVALVLLLLGTSGSARATLIRYQLTTPYPTSYFDYDTSTSTLGSFLIQSPAPPGPLNPAFSNPATSIIFESPNAVHFTDTVTTLDASTRFEWTLEFSASFGKDGSYDGVFASGETLHEYNLSDNQLVLISIAPLGGSFGFFSTGPSPVQVIPEPETAAMLFAGLGLLGLMGRRRRSRKTAAA